MDTTGRTPGPWERRGHAIYQQSEEYLALIYDNGSCDDTYTNLFDADWDLIAAAPEILDALKEYVRVMEDPRTTTAMPHTVAKARAAIAKAEGR